jgi:hypothetical protein
MAEGTTPGMEEVEPRLEQRPRATQGRSGLLPSRGITPSMEGRSAEREAVSE